MTKIQGKMKKKQQIEFTINSQLPVCMGEAVGEGEKPVFMLLSNTGKKAEVGGSPLPIVIDMEGVSFTREKIPILIEHDTNRRFGTSVQLQVLKAGESVMCRGKEVHGPMVLATCVRTSNREEALTVEKDILDGFPFQVSIGGYLEEVERSEKGKTAFINGQDMSGDYLRATKTVIREISICTFGADDDTEVKLSRESGTLIMSDMTNEKTGNEAPKDLEMGAPASKEMDLNNIELKRVEELKKITDEYKDNLKDCEIRCNGKKFNGIAEFCREAVLNGGISPTEYKLACLRADLASAVAPRPSIQESKSEITGDLLAIGMLREFGVPESQKDANTGEEFGIEKWYDEKTLDMADRCKAIRGGISMHSVLNAAIEQATGSRYEGFNTHCNDFYREARRAMQILNSGRRSFGMAGSGSTVDITNVFEDVGNKILEAAYRVVQTSWQEWVKTVNVSNFNQVKMYSVESTGLLTPLGADGTLERGGFAEGKTTVSAQTFGRIEGLTRSQIINDDMGVFHQLWSNWGTLAPRTYEEAVYTTLLENATTMFTAAGGNLATTGSELTIDGLTKVCQLIGKRTTADGSPLFDDPKYILVGTALEPIARALMTHEFVNWNTVSKNAPTQKNLLCGKFQVLKSPYLDNTALKQKIYKKNRGKAFPNQSASQYFILPSANDICGTPLIAAFLNGNRVPTIETEDADFERLGMQWRIYTDFGVSVWKPELAIRATGEA